MANKKKPSASKQLADRAAETVKNGAPVKKKNLYVVGMQYLEVATKTVVQKQIPDLDLDESNKKMEEILSMHESGEIVLRVLSVGPFQGTLPAATRPN